MKEIWFCLSCKREVYQLAFEFDTFGEQQKQEYEAHFGVCYECFNNDWEKLKE